VQTTGIGVHEGRQDQAAARAAPAVWGEGTGRAVLLWKTQGESSEQPGRERGRADVVEARVSYPSSVSSRSEVGSSDMSTGNGAGAGDTRI
jgi:anti-sigma factor RsiW